MVELQVQLDILTRCKDLCKGVHSPSKMEVIPFLIPLSCCRTLASRPSLEIKHRVPFRIEIFESLTFVSQFSAVVVVSQPLIANDLTMRV